MRPLEPRDEIAALFQLPLGARMTFELSGGPGLDAARGAGPAVPSVAFRAPGGYGAPVAYAPLTPGAGVPPPAAATHSLEDMERATIAQALAAVGGNRRLAAERLGIGLRTLYDKLRRYAIE